MSAVLLLFLFAGYVLHREVRIRELKGVVSGAWSRKDGVCGVARVSGACYNRLLNGRPCLSAEKSLKPPIPILVDKLKHSRGEHTPPRTRLVSDLRGGSDLSGLTIIEER